MGSRPHIYGRGTYKNTTLGFLRPSERIAPERCPHGSCPPSYIPSGPLPVREAPLTGPTREGSAKNCPPPPRRGEGDNSDASRRLRTPFLKSLIFRPLRGENIRVLSKKIIYVRVFRRKTRRSRRKSKIFFDIIFFEKRGFEDLRVARRDLRASRVNPFDKRSESIREYSKILVKLTIV
jgi:hypothetical protein